MFRFTIRDLLWLMVVVGLAIVWLADHCELVVLRNVAEDRDIHYKYQQRETNKWIAHYHEERLARIRLQEEVASLRQMLGEKDDTAKEISRQVQIITHDPAGWHFDAERER